MVLLLQGRRVERRPPEVGSSTGRMSLKGKMSTVKLGKAAEHIFIARCLLAGIDCFPAINEDTKVDLIVGRRLLRCQVKVINGTPSHGFGSKTMRVQKAGCNSASNIKVYNYTAEDIDLFVGVEIETFDVYIIPIEFAEHYRSSISLSTIEQHGFKNNFDFLK
jgi:hypothetical protein